MRSFLVRFVDAWVSTSGVAGEDASPPPLQALPSAPCQLVPDHCFRSTPTARRELRPRGILAAVLTATTRAATATAKALLIAAHAPTPALSLLRATKPLVALVLLTAESTLEVLGSFDDGTHAPLLHASPQHRQHVRRCKHGLVQELDDPALHAMLGKTAPRIALAGATEPRAARGAAVQATRVTEVALASAASAIYCESSAADSVADGISP